MANILRTLFSKKRERISARAPETRTNEENLVCKKLPLPIILGCIIVILSFIVHLITVKEYNNLTTALKPKHYDAVGMRAGYSFTYKKGTLVYSGRAEEYNRLNWAKKVAKDLFGSRWSKDEFDLANRGPLGSLLDLFVSDSYKIYLQFFPSLYKPFSVVH